jgi:type IV secretion system protein TrbI
MDTNDQNEAPAPVDIGLPEEIVQDPGQVGKKEPGQSGKSGDLLQKGRIRVARFSRRKIVMLAGALLAMVALAVAANFTPGKKLSAREHQDDAAQKQAAETKPNLPEAANQVPDNYVHLPKTGLVKDSIQNAAPEGADNGGANGNAEPPPGGQVSAAQGNLSPAQQLKQSVREQRQKDRESASKAPLSFGGSGGGPRAESAPVSPLAAFPQAPDPAGGMSRVLEKFASGQGQGQGEEDQNKQEEKRGFTREDRKDFPYLKTSLLTPISPYEVKAGTILPGVLITGMNSDLPGQITAQARENVYDTVSGRYLLIPIGSRYIGEYDSKISYGQERLLVVWTRVIMPNGNSISLENMPGIDLSGYAGVSGKVNNHYGKLITGVVLGSILGATAQVAVGGQGTAISPPSFGQLATAGAAQNLNQAGQRITERNLNLQPTIEAAPGQKINIFVTKDMILKPYTD